ncbi:hypothetical protein SDC9_56747 [bioreactor metagenome]|uniref:Uncharacterized protein n=1 Tax=bioreactor metagenome TaxID=1076179 RepID=A0A644X2N6_9ZZZZ
MENNKIENLLMQILEKQTAMQSDISSMKSDLTEIKEKVSTVYDQTADLTEFRTEIKETANNISKDVKFIKHKLYETEQDVFDIKDHLSIVK